jgi:hypothetical protein
MTVPAWTPTLRCARILSGSVNKKVYFLEMLRIAFLHTRNVKQRLSWLGIHMEMPQVDLDLPPPYSVLHLRLEAMPLLLRFVLLLYHL